MFNITDITVSRSYNILHVLHNIIIFSTSQIISSNYHLIIYSLLSNRILKARTHDNDIECKYIQSLVLDICSNKL